MDRTPLPGEFYRHFKNKMYQIIAVATHSETGEKMVVYQALYGNFGVYVRPLNMFTEPVDRKKYPDASQEYRFEQVSLRAEDPLHCEMNVEETNQEEIGKINSLLLEFLDEEGYDKRLAILQNMKGKVGQQELDSLYMSLDLTSVGGAIEDQLDNIKQYLSMQQRYDASRMRRGHDNV